MKIQDGRQFYSAKKIVSIFFLNSNTKHTQNAILKQNTKFYQNMSVNKRVTEL